MYNVLIVEDNDELCEIIDFYISQSNNYKPTFTHSAEDALEIIQSQQFDVILLDIMLPNMDGIAFCQKVREQIYCPIIFTSCLNDDETITKAIHMGGDDYLVKPFRGPVLLAHMEANIRRSKRSAINTDLTANDLRIEAGTHQLFKNNQLIALSPTEYNIMKYLMERPNVYISFEDLYQAIWNEPSLNDYRSLFVHIRNLRKKIENDPQNPTHILTHNRDGYIFN